jgi:hypothetical protein
LSPKVIYEYGIGWPRNGYLVISRNTKLDEIFAEFRGPGALWNEKQLAMWRVGGNAANNDLQKSKVPVVAVTV